MTAHLDTIVQPVSMDVGFHEINKISLVYEQGKSNPQDLPDLVSIRAGKIVICKIHKTSLAQRAGKIVREMGEESSFLNLGGKSVNLADAMTGTKGITSNTD